MMNKQKLPHFITVVSFVVFIVLGLACASTPSSSKSSRSSSSPSSSTTSSSTSTSQSTGNVLFESKRMTGRGITSEIFQIYIGIRAKDEFYLIKGPAQTGNETIIALAMDASKNATEINRLLTGDYNRRMEDMFNKKPMKEVYFVSSGDFVLDIDDKEFSLASEYQKIPDDLKTVSAVVSKSVVLSNETLFAISECSTLQIGYKAGGRFVKELEITGDGLISIKDFIKDVLP